MVVNDTVKKIDILKMEYKITQHSIVFFSRMQKVGHIAPKPSSTTELSLTHKKREGG